MNTEIKKDDFIKKITEMSQEELRIFLSEKGKQPKSRVLMYIEDDKK